MLDAAAAARGKVLFESTEVGCTACHAGEQLAVGGNFDVGTGGHFQVPTLIGVGLRTPVMHDGCAETLRQRFDPGCGGGDFHGRTSQLDEAQLDDLTAFLQTL